MTKNVPDVLMSFTQSSQHKDDYSAVMRRNYQTLANNLPPKTSADERPVSLEHSVNERQQAASMTSDELNCGKLAVCVFQARQFSL